MAEGYLIRRGASGSGVSDLNIWGGSSPPSSDVGVFGETSGNISNKYVVPENVSGEGSWTIGNYSTTPVVARKCMPAVNGNIVYIQYTNRALYAHNTTTDTWSLYTTNSEQAAWTTGGLVYLNGIIYSITTPAYNSAGAFTLYMYDTSSQLWSASSIYQGDCYGVNGAIYYQGNIYIPIGYGSFMQDYMFAYSISSDTCSMVGGYGGRPYRTGRAVVQDGKYLFVYGGEQNNTGSTGPRQMCLRWDMETQTYATFPTPYASNVLWKPVFLGAIIGSTLCGFVAGQTTVIGIDKDELSPSWSVSNYSPAPTVAVRSFQSTQVATVGNDIWFYGGGNTGNLVYKYSITGDVENYPDGSLVVECGSSTNHAEIISGEEQSVTINVKNVYYSNGSTLSVVPGKVRVSGGEWTDIVN